MQATSRHRVLRLIVCTCPKDIENCRTKPLFAEERAHKLEKEWARVTIELR